MPGTPANFNASARGIPDDLRTIGNLGIVLPIFLRKLSRKPELIHKLSHMIAKNRIRHMYSSVFIVLQKQNHVNLRNSAISPLMPSSLDVDECAMGATIASAYSDRHTVPYYETI